MKFTTISKIPNTSQMLIIPFLSMHYICNKDVMGFLAGVFSSVLTVNGDFLPQY